MIDRSDILSSLHEGVCEVTFEKTNGELRIMSCTLRQDMIPFVPQEEGEKKRTKTPNEEVQPVYDVKAPGWRSFRWDSVKEFKKL